MKKVKIYCDGASRGNPGPAAAAFVVLEEGKEIKRFKTFLGIGTNNQAEYAAILMAHQWLVSQEGQSLRLEKVEFVLDSELAVKQLNNIYKIRNPKIAEYVAEIKDLQKRLKYPISFFHVKREQNSIADGLANEALDERMKK